MLSLYSILLLGREISGVMVEMKVLIYTLIVDIDPLLPLLNQEGQRRSYSTKWIYAEISGGVATI